MKKFIIAGAFALMAWNSYAQIADSTQREVKLEGAVNFRDIGGYETKDGHHVKWGKIFRSGALNKLSNTDLDKLKALKIAVDADFRGNYEVALAPDRIPGNTRRISLPAGSEDAGKPEGLKKMLQSKNKDSMMIAFYTNLAVFKDRYKPVFDELLMISPDSALLYHCSAGKDRTGMATALILYTLGVPEEKIMEDYLASNYYRKNIVEKDAAQLVQHFGLTPEQAKGLAGVKEEYLMATYNAILQHYGSMDKFLETELGITPEKRQLLRKKYLEQ